MRRQPPSLRAVSLILALVAHRRRTKPPAEPGAASLNLRKASSNCVLAVRFGRRAISAILGYAGVETNGRVPGGKTWREGERETRRIAWKTRFASQQLRVSLSSPLLPRCGLPELGEGR